MIVLLMTIAFQSQKFYEHYEVGVKRFQDEDYKGAIDQLEKAIQIDPMSSANKRTYGVQLIKYFPYVYLTEAHLILGEDDAARKYLALAKNYGEDRDEYVRIQLALFEGYLIPEVDTTPVLDTRGINDLISVGNFEGALQLIRTLQKDHPDDETLATLRRFAENALKSSRDLAALQDRIQQDVNDVLSRARQAERENDLESAYFFYQLVDRKLVAGHPEARSFISRYEARLDQSEDKLQIDFLESRIAEMESDNAILLERLEAQKLDRQSLAEVIDELRQQSDQAKRLSPQVVPNVTIDWFKTFTDSRYWFNAQINSNVTLLRASLSVNDQRVGEWDLRGKKVFHLPNLTDKELPVKEGLNQFNMYITDYQSQTHMKTFRTELVYPKNEGLALAIRLSILGVSMLMLMAYVIHQRRLRTAFRERFNPYIAGAPVLTDNMFYGRRALLKQILNTLHNNSLMICGERRIGKTSFLHRLNAVLPTVEDEIYDFIPVLIDLQGVAESDFFAFLDHEITGTLSLRGFDLEPTPDEVDARLFAQRLRKAINLLKERLEKSPKLVLLLDEVDVMNTFSERTNQQLRSVFMKGFAQHLVAVMAGIHISKRWKSEGSPWYNFFEQIQLSAFNDSQARHLVADPVKGVYSFTPPSIDMILELTQGKPYLIQKICVNLVAHILNVNRRKIREEDVQFVYEQIKHEFDQSAANIEEGSP
ncbi:MAG: hypothetical protein KDC35_15455 [Acidobacteria bacterium]|nr:hypothetical protein [Acidobacteriota bacterium]